ncbi:MAG: GtrA family protein [Pseudomonadota bacterium]
MALKQFTNFLGVGAFATMAHYSVLLALVEIFLTNAIIASGTGALIGAITSYVLNRNYTFRSKLPHNTAMPRFFAVAALAVFANVLLMKLFVDGVEIPYFAAQVVTTILLITITFGLNKFWSFHESEQVKEH